MNARLYKSFDPTIRAATRLCRTRLNRETLEPLSRNCPGLKTFDWDNYLLCSMFRIEAVLATMRTLFTRKVDVKILDFGAWLSNFSLALALDGWPQVTACELWMRYAPALDAYKQLLADYHVDTLDSVMITGRPQGPRYNVALLMSVIEHIPDSPRGLLCSLYNAILPGGYLILDTPNLAYIANRRKLKRGLSPYVPIAEQFYTERPFEGHVREYTAAELRWMLGAVGFNVLSVNGYNYSMFGVKYPVLMNARSFLPMYLDPLKRELLFVVAQRKPEFDK